MTQTILKIEHLNKIYRIGTMFNRLRIDALDDINLEIKNDSPIIISLVGESGSGKTTLAKVLLRLIAPTSGNARIYNDAITREKHQRNNSQFLKNIQPIFQNPFEAFNSYRTVDTYLRTTGERLTNMRGSELDDKIFDSLSFVGLKYEDVVGKYPNQFSGGELQRVSVARTLIPNPKMIVADEPVSMIDASLRMNVVNLFLSLVKEYNTSFLYITHDLATAYYISDYIAVMYRGCIVELGSSKDVLTYPCHPYTRLLLDSIATVNRKWGRTRLMNSEIESKEYQFSGCKFHNRCPYAKDICSHQRPEPLDIDEGHIVYCHFAESI